MSVSSKKRIKNTLERLETELAHLKEKFRMGHELRLEWIPNSGPKSGEVNGTTIRIYEADQTKALDTLRHEFIEYVLTEELVAPYKQFINRLICVYLASWAIGLRARVYTCLYYGRAETDRKKTDPLR